MKLLRSTRTIPLCCVISATARVEAGVVEARHRHGRKALRYCTGPNALLLADQEQPGKLSAETHQARIERRPQIRPAGMVGAPLGLKVPDLTSFVRINLNMRLSLRLCKVHLRRGDCRLSEIIGFIEAVAQNLFSCEGLV